jgi:hypothetical protein
VRLHGELKLSQVRLLGCKIEPTKEDPKITLAFRTALTRDVAYAFGCRELIYAGDVARSGVEQMNLEGEELDCQVHFTNDNAAFSAVAVSVGHYVAKLEGDGPKLCFQVKLTGYAGPAAELVEKVKIDPLEVTLRPAQMELGLSGEPSAETPALAPAPEDESTPFELDEVTVQ